MKKLYSLLVAALCALPMLAGSYTITISGSNTTITSQGVTISASQGTAQNAPVVNTNTTTGEVDYRVYSGSTFTISCTENITNISFTLSTKGVERQAKLTPSKGTMSQTAKASTASWSGSAGSITFTVGAKAEYGTDNTKAGQFNFTQFTVTTDSTTPVTPDTITPQPGGDVNITNLDYADAYLYEYDGYKYLDLDLYAENDYPEVYLQCEVNSLTAIAGSYSLLYGGYWKSENDSVESDTEAEDYVGSMTITYANEVYTISGSFTATDGKKYAFSCTPDLVAYDDEYNEIELNENGGSVVPVEGAISVSQAISIGKALADNATTSETYTVVGYVAKLYNSFKDGTQSFYMSDEKNSTATRFDFEAFQCSIASPGTEVGDYVQVTGQITKYVSKSGNTTIEISKGKAEILYKTAIEDINAEAAATKHLENGRIVIYRGDRCYTTTGQTL